MMSSGSASQMKGFASVMLCSEMKRLMALSEQIRSRSSCLPVSWANLQSLPLIQQFVGSDPHYSPVLYPLPSVTAPATRLPAFYQPGLEPQRLFLRMSAVVAMAFVAVPAGHSEAGYCLSTPAANAAGVAYPREECGRYRLKSSAQAAISTRAWSRLRNSVSLSSSSRMRSLMGKTAPLPRDRMLVSPI